MNVDQNKNQYFWNFAFIVFFMALVLFAIYLFKELNKVPLRISVFDFILLILATFRLTHLFVYDHITGFIRDYFDKFRGGPGKTIANLLSCLWCTGIWTSFFLGVLYFLTPYAWFFIFVLALAGAAISFKIIIDRLMID